jgi:hypothetical protein
MVGNSFASKKKSMFTEGKNRSLSQTMRQHVSLWEASNQSPREYCEGKDFTVHKLNYWRYKIRKEKRGKPGVSGGFTRVEPLASSAAASQGPNSSAMPSLEVTLSNGNRFVFYEDPSKDLLKIFL